jgi:hypothetical protein
VIRIREAQRLASVLGRRSALKYVGLGLAATVLGACGGEKGRSKNGSKGGSGVAGNTVEAFAKGKWKLSAGGARCTLTVGDGRWEIGEGTPAPGEEHGPLTRELKGTYTLSGRVLEVSAAEEGRSADRRVAEPLPSQVSDAESLTVRWNFDGSRSQVPVTWDGKKLVVVFDNHDGPLVISAERA